ncbi:uronyl 2-sulfotransferase-like [Ornithodoros turicata]|uniref:uronyl 2-sulfotransferase-like n=1 Tax=Ornithodoros turicata TaxID=34597 RepID=UPI00313959FC
MTCRSRGLAICSVILLVMLSLCVYLARPTLYWTTVYNQDVSSRTSMRLFYNRVPKCGSTTLLTLLRRLSGIHQFRHVHSKTYDKRLLSRPDQEELAKMISSEPAPLSYDRHVYFLDFPSFGLSPPSYINVLREPTERIASSFYYRHSVGRGNLSVAWRQKSLEDCIVQGHAECSFLEGQENHWALTVPFFCGQDPHCTLIQNTWALQKAKENIDQHYTVVGVLEELNSSLALLEERLPQFFRGARHVFREQRLHQNRNKNPIKRPVPTSVREMLRKNLSHEYDLYDFVQQRFRRQLQTYVEPTSLGLR